MRYRTSIFAAQVALLSFVVGALPGLAAGAPNIYLITCAKGPPVAQPCGDSQKITVECESNADPLTSQHCKTLCQQQPGAASDGSMCSAVLQQRLPQPGAQPSDAPPTAPAEEANVTVQLKNPIGVKSVPELVGRVIDAMLGVLGAGAFLMFVYGGLLWLISAGSADRIKKGKNVMVWAALGLVLVFASAALVRFTLSLFGAAR